MIIKPTANLVAVTTQDTVNNSTLVRIQAGSLTTVAIKNASNTHIGTFIMPAGTVEIVEKAATDTITCSAVANCTPVAYKS
jgi:hypothetical protein